MIERAVSLWGAWLGCVRAHRSRLIGGGVLAGALALVVSGCTLPPGQETASLEHDYPSTVEFDPLKDMFSLNLADGASRAYGLHLSPQEQERQKKKHKFSPDGEPAVMEYGRASWYADRFHGRLTASGERYNMNALTAAHRSLPFDTQVCVRGLLRHKEVLVRINDRGPFTANRIIDLSRAAAEKLDMLQLGLKDVVLWIPDKEGPQCGDGTAKIDPSLIVDN